MMIKMRKNKNASPLRRHLALNLQVARTIRGWSQEDLGLRCGLKRTYIGAVERAEINPGIDNLDRIANGIGVACYVLLMDPEQAQPLIYRTLSKATG